MFLGMGRYHQDLKIAAPYCTGRPGLVSLDRPFWTDEPRHDRGGKPEGRGQPGQVSQDSSALTVDRLAWTGKPGQVSLTD